jgi:hypothetical protein
MTTASFTIQTNDSSQVEALKAFLKALKIKFEFNTEKPYNTDFVNMVLEADKEIKAGKGTKLTAKEFDDLWK